MGLAHHEGLLLAVRHYHEFDCLFPVPSLFAVVGHDGGDGRGRTLVSEDILRFLKVIEIAQVDPDDVLPGLSILIGLLGFLEGAFAFLGLAVFHQDGLRLDLLHDRSSLLEHFQLQVQDSGFLEVFTFFIDLCSLEVLLHVLADHRNVSQQGFILYFSGNVETALDVAQLNRGSGNSSETLHVVLVNYSLRKGRDFIVDDRFLELLQSFSVVALRLGLSGQSLADEVLLLWRDVLGEGGGDEPVLDIAAHV
jgi:hypothetical protein